MRASIVLAALALAACGSVPKPVDPPPLRAALEAESDGAKHYGRGDYAAAARRFEEAARRYVGIDDAPGALRARLHLARAELARGRAEPALAVLAGIDDGSGAAHALDVALLRAQAQLALERTGAAEAELATAAARCTGACPQAASLHLLQGRAALAAGRTAEALAHAQAALKLLADKDEAHETANAWRLVAASRLASGDAPGALPAADSALTIDRRLALPEKIAGDWLLIGDIHARAGNADAATNAYRRALAIADAAGLPGVAASSTQRLARSAAR